MDKKKRPRCHNCKFAGESFKIIGKTHMHCEHPKHDVEAEDFSAWDTLCEFWETCKEHEFKTISVTKGKVKPLLHLNLKRKWFDMIRSGEKKEEYREIKPYWNRVFGRANILINGRYYHPTDIIICFANGYRKDRPEMLFECTGMKVAEGRPEWGAEPGQQYYVFSLGNEIQLPTVTSQYVTAELPF